MKIKQICAAGTLLAGSLQGQVGAIPPMPPMAPVPPMVSIHGFSYQSSNRGDGEDREYRAGTMYLDRREWERAVQAFNSVVTRKGERADAAFYWKGYAEAKLGRRDQALSTLAEMQKQYSNSRWVNDARSLAMELRAASGQAVSPERQADEDLKLMAINSLMGSDPERAVPLLDKVLATSTSPKVKERALFVLAHSNTPQGREIVTQYAKGKGNPDLQMRAVDYLGQQGSGENQKVLAEVYTSNPDVGVKRRVIRSFGNSGNRDQLLTLARSEKDANLRIEAVRQLGNINAQDQLSQLYKTETEIGVKEEILRSLGNSGDSARLTDLAKAEKDVTLRKRAVRSLANMGGHGAAGETLAGLYKSESDASVKREILNGLANGGSTRQLIAVVRAETDPDLKREGVQRLANMKDKEATEFMMELLK